jgi:hypothetical protein
VEHASWDKRQRTDQDLRSGFFSETQAAASNPEKTRFALANDLQTASDPHTQLSQPANPRRFSGNIPNFRPSAGFNQIQGKQLNRSHESTLPKRQAGVLVEIESQSTLPSGHELSRALKEFFAAAAARI